VGDHPFCASNTGPSHLAGKQPPLPLFDTGRRRSEVPTPAKAVGVAVGTERSQARPPGDHEASKPLTIATEDPPRHSSSPIPAGMSQLATAPAPPRSTRILTWRHAWRLCPILVGRRPSSWPWPPAWCWRGRNPGNDRGVGRGRAPDPVRLAWRTDARIRTDLPFRPSRRCAVAMHRRQRPPPTLSQLRFRVLRTASGHWRHPAAATPAARPEVEVAGVPPRREGGPEPEERPYLIDHRAVVDVMVAGQ
jgi:hypothetical protein